MNPVFTLALVFILAACAGIPTPTAPSPATSTPPPMPSPAATMAPVSIPSGPAPVLVDYERSGGFAGMIDHLVIDANGHATLARRSGAREFDLSRDQLNQLQAVFQSAGFATIDENSMPKTVPPDAFTYAITYQGHRVKTADSAVPSQLQPVLEALNRLL